MTCEGHLVSPDKSSTVRNTGTGGDRSFGDRRPVAGRKRDDDVVPGLVFKDVKRDSDVEKPSHEGKTYINGSEG